MDEPPPAGRRGPAFRAGRLRPPRRPAVRRGPVRAGPGRSSTGPRSRLSGCSSSAPAAGRAEQRRAAGRPAEAGGSARRPGSAAGTVAAFTVAVAPFAAPWPGLFVRSTLLDQAARAGSAVPETLRLANLTGLGLLLDDAGRFTGSTGVRPVRPERRDRRGDLGYRRTAGAARLSRASPWPASATAPGATRWAGTRSASDGYGGGRTGLLGLLLSLRRLRRALAGPVGRLRRRRAARAGRPAAAAAARRAGRRRRASAAGQGAPRRRLTAAVLTVAGWQGWQLSGLHAADVADGLRAHPPGRLRRHRRDLPRHRGQPVHRRRAGRPDVLDSLATTLVAGDGVSVQGGAAAFRPWPAGWKRIFAQAGRRVAVLVERPPDPVDHRRSGRGSPAPSGPWTCRRGRSARDSCTSGADRAARPG